MSEIRLARPVLIEMVPKVWRYELMRFRKSAKVRLKLKPVPGGRWKVRAYVTDDGLTIWRAWSEGNARRMSAFFCTHGMAIKWAHHAARVWKDGDENEITAVLRHAEFRRDILGIRVANTPR